MDWRNADWVPWYVDDTATWLELSLAARGAMEGVARKLNRRTGALELRRGLPSLAGLLRVSWAELEPALNELFKAGKLTWDGDAGLLRDPDYLERRRPTSTDRVRDHRKRKAGDLGLLQDPTDGDAGLPGEPPDSETHETLHPFPQPRVEESRSEIPIDQRAGARAGEPPLTDRRRERLKAICLAAGVDLDADDEWATYVADRRRKGKAITDPDWEYWLRNAVKFARRDRSRAAASRPEPTTRGRKSLEGFRP